MGMGERACPPVLTLNPQVKLVDVVFYVKHMWLTGLSTLISPRFSEMSVISKRNSLSPTVGRG